MHRIADLAVDPVACPVASSTPLFDRQQNLRNRFGARFRAEIAFAVDTDADGVGFEITLSDHKHGVDFHLLGALDFAVDRCLPVLPVYRSFRTIWHMDEPSKSLINIGDLGKPAEALVNKISDAVGGLFAPWQIKRIAKAEAEAVIIKARGEIEVTDLQRRAMHRFINEEASRQKNIEDITAKALPQLTDAADPDARPSGPVFWLAKQMLLELTLNAPSTFLLIWTRLTLSYSPVCVGSVGRLVI